MLSVATSRSSSSPSAMPRASSAATTLSVYATGVVLLLLPCVSSLTRVPLLVSPSSALTSRRAAIHAVRLQVAGDDGLGGSSGSEGGDSQDDSDFDDAGKSVSGVAAMVVPRVLHKEMTDSYMAYAMSVIMSRALPDVRDGLKPVHRRILFAMHELNLSPSGPHRKCARVVGEGSRVLLLLVSGQCVR